MTDKPRNLISFKEAMSKLGCKKDRLYRLIKDEKVFAYKDGNMTKVDADSIVAYQGTLPRMKPGH